MYIHTLYIHYLSVVQGGHEEALDQVVQVLRQHQLVVLVRSEV